MVGAVGGPEVTRRDFLRLAAGAGGLLAAGAGCDTGSKAATPKATAPSDRRGRAQATLRITQSDRYVAGYDRWWDEEYTRLWGERNGIEVLVDHFDITQEEVHAQAEVAARRGHDIFQLHWVSTAFEDDVIDHAEIVQAVEARAGDDAVRRTQRPKPQDREVPGPSRLLDPQPDPLPAGPLGAPRVPS